VIRRRRRHRANSVRRREFVLQLSLPQKFDKFYATGEGSSLDIHSQAQNTNLVASFDITLEKYMD